MRCKTVVGLAAALSLITTAASASHSLNFQVVVANPSPDANSDWTTSVDFGTAHPDSSITHVEGLDFLPGPTSPSDGDIVAETSARARWKALFCATSTITIDGEWVSPMNTPPPGISNEVAQIQFNLLGTTIDAWVTEQTSGHGSVGGAHYDIEIPDHGDSACSSGDVSIDTTWYGTVAGTSVPIWQNPGCGTYDVDFEYVDKSSNAHSDTDTYTITGPTC